MEDIAYKGPTIPSLGMGQSEWRNSRPALPLRHSARSYSLRHANINASVSLSAPDFSSPISVGYSGAGKRLLDIVLVLVTLPLALPVIAICALALWLEGGQPFYRQQRLGQWGQRFPILKLRTMVRDADASLEQYLAQDPALRREWDQTQKLKQDPRITRVGKFLRASSLDELPQLWNVLMGEMSLVGPRPMMPDQLPLYGDASDYFALKPGITGVWQVSARNESRFSYRAQVDALYRQEMTLRGDLTLMLRTVGVVLRGTGY